MRDSLAVVSIYLLDQWNSSRGILINDPLCRKSTQDFPPSQAFAFVRLISKPQSSLDSTISGVLSRGIGPRNYVSGLTVIEMCSNKMPPPLKGNNW